MTLLMSYPLSPHLVGPLVEAKTVHQQKKGPNLTRFISKFTNMLLFKQTQLYFFIHLNAQGWFVAHLLSQKNRTRRESCTRRRVEEVISSSLVTSMKRPDLRRAILSCFWYRVPHRL